MKLFGNGTQACGNAHTLGALRSHMGFAGWVMSDWWAVTSVRQSWAAGLDVTMPGNDDTYTPAHLAQVPNGRSNLAPQRCRRRRRC